MSKNNESKTIKDALKEARENIDKKDFKAALKCCKRALNVDNKNYTALVFYGLCSSELEMFDQALQAYKKATESNPGQLTAWQGLCSFYEKKKGMTPENLQDQAQVYEKLLQFFQASDDQAKYFMNSDKLVSLHLTKLNQTDKAVQELQKRTEFAKEKGKTDKIYYAQTEIIKILSQKPNLDEEESHILKETLVENISDDSKSIQNVENMKALVRHLYNRREMEELLNFVLKMSKMFPENNYPLEWICKIYLEYVTDTLNFKNAELEESIETFVFRLKEANEASTLAKLAEAATIWKIQANLSLAKEKLSHILDGSNNPNFYGLYILCQCYISLRDFSNAEKSIKFALVLLKDKVKEEQTRLKLDKELKNILATVLYNQRRFQDIPCIVDSETCDQDLKVILVKSLAHLGKRVESEALFDSVDEPVKNLSEAILLKNESRLVESLKKLQELKPDFECMALQAEIEWAQSNFEKSQLLFLQAAKSNPNSWLPFYFLGQYYKRAGAKQDLERARKCFQKSFALNPSSTEAGSALSDILRTQENFEENLQFLLSVTEEGNAPEGQSNWAHLRLGMHYLATDNPSQAIISLQMVLRNDPTNLTAWESLADAYFKRGSFTSALKAYDKVQTLQSDAESSCYAGLQIASIKLKLGYFRESKLALREILARDPSYVPALKVMAECLLNEARDLLTQCLDKNVVDNCQEAVSVLVRALSQSSNFACLWKLLGEALLLMHALPREVAVLQVPSVLLKISGDNKSTKSLEEITQLQGLALASKALARALQIQPQNVSCWQDLALSFHYRHLLTQEVELKRQAFDAARKALALRPKDHALWNLLGLLALHHEDFALAQHAFIRSIRLSSHPMAWSNLGIMYYLQGKSDLSNKAFQEAQNADPTYLQGWIGQALLAEASGFDEEAIDLFRHCTFLGNGLESALGYGHWICQTLREMDNEPSSNNSKKHSRYCVEQMHGVAVAVDALTHYADRVPSDPCGLNMLGVLLEKQRHFRSAKKCLTKALVKLQSNEDKPLLDQVLHNLARVLYKLGELEASIKCYQKMGSSNFHSKVGLALSSWKAEKFAQAYSAYGEALQSATTTEQRSHVLAAMATIAFKFQGPDAAKTLLFQSVQQRPPSLQGILALCVLGLQQSNPTLVQAAIAEMDKHKDNKKAEIIAMKALVMTLQGQPVAARRLISKAIHQNPQDGSLWKCMAIHLIQNHQDSTQLSCSAANCAQKAAMFFSDLQESSALMSLVGLCSLNGGNPSMAKRAALKAAHCYPQKLEPWSVLYAASEASESKARVLATLKSLIQPDSTLSDWVQSQQQ